MLIHIDDYSFNPNNILEMFTNFENNTVIILDNKTNVTTKYVIKRPIDEVRSIIDQYTDPNIKYTSNEVIIGSDHYIKDNVAKIYNHGSIYNVCLINGKTLTSYIGE